MLTGLDDIAWGRLEHCYGAASDVPVLLREIAVGERKSLSDLAEKLVHQSSRYTASAAALPFLAELAGAPSLPAELRAGLLGLISDVRVGFSNDYLVDDEELRELDEDDDDLVVELQETYEQIVPTVRALLDDPEPMVRETAALALMWQRIDPAASAGAVSRRLTVEQVAPVRLMLLLALGHLGDDAGDLPRALETGGPADRLGAALALTMAPDDCPQDAVAVILLAEMGHQELVHAAMPGSYWWSDLEELTEVAVLAREGLPALDDEARGALIGPVTDALSRGTGPRAAEVVLRVAFGGGTVDLADATSAQRAALIALVESDDPWTQTAQSWTVGALQTAGLPAERNRLAELLGVTVLQPVDEESPETADELAEGSTAEAGTADDTAWPPAPVDWDRLTHYYGSAADIPELLAAVAANDAAAVGRLRARLMTWDSRFEASAPAVPFLVELASRPGLSVAVRTELVVLVARLVVGSPRRQLTEDKDLKPDAGVFAAYESVVPMLRPLLADPEPEVREAVAMALFWHREGRAATVAALADRLAVEPSAPVRFMLLLTFAAHGGDRGVLRAALATDRPAADRLGAAIGLTRLKPKSCPRDAVIVLLLAAIGDPELLIPAVTDSYIWHYLGELFRLVDNARRRLSAIDDETRALAIGPMIEVIPRAIGGYDHLVLEVALGPGARPDVHSLTPVQRSAIVAILSSPNFSGLGNFRMFGLTVDGLRSIGIDLGTAVEGRRDAGPGLRATGRFTPANPTSRVVTADVLVEARDCWRPDRNPDSFSAFGGRLYLHGKEFTGLVPRSPTLVELDDDGAPRPVLPDPSWQYADVAGDGAGGFYLLDRDDGQARIVHIGPNNEVRPSVVPPVWGVATLNPCSAGGQFYLHGSFRYPDDPALPEMNGLLRVDESGDVLATFVPQPPDRVALVVPTPEAVYAVVADASLRSGYDLGHRLVVLDPLQLVPQPWPGPGPANHHTIERVFVDSERLYLQLDAKSGMYPRVVAYDRATGELVWSRSVVELPWTKVLAVAGGRLYLATAEWPQVVGPGQIRALDATAGVEIASVTTLGAATFGAVRDDRLVISGLNLREVQGQSRPGIAELRLDSLAPTSFVCGLTIEDNEHKIVVSGDRLLVGDLLGREVGGRPHLAAVDLATGHPAEFVPEVDGCPIMPPTPDGSLWVGRRAEEARPTNAKKKARSEEARTVARLDAVSGAVRGPLVATDGRVEGGVYDPVRERMYLWGEFTKVNGEPRQYLAAIDGRTHALLDFDPAPNRKPTDLLVDGDRVWLAGDFTSLGGQASPRLVSMDPDSGAWTAPAVPDGGVEVMCLAGPWVLFGGRFGEFDGTPSPCLAGIDRRTGRVLNCLPVPTHSDGPNTSAHVWLLKPWGDMVFLRGGFDTLGGVRQRGISAIQIPTGAVMDLPAELPNSVLVTLHGEDVLAMPAHVLGIGIDPWKEVAYWRLTRPPGPHEAAHQSADHADDSDPLL